MRVLLTGGTGFIGSAVVRALAERGDECVVISRSGRNLWPDRAVQIIRADPTMPGAWQEEAGRSDAVVNLAGAPIVEPPRRWSQAHKRLIWVSRVVTTERVVTAIRAAERPPRVLVSGSAVGYYGDRGDQLLHETSGSGTDFLSRMASAWESAALAARDDTRVALLRTGIVLAPDGGALQPLLRLFRLGLGGPWGNGRQWWSWIHRTDAVGLILLALDTDLGGPINITAPNPVTVNEFAASLGRALGRPAALRAPAFALRLALGESADSLLHGQRVIPTRAMKAGYSFRFEQVEAALREMLEAGKSEGQGRGKS